MTDFLPFPVGQKYRSIMTFSPVPRCWNVNCGYRQTRLSTAFLQARPDRRTFSNVRWITLTPSTACDPAEEWARQDEGGRLGTPGGASLLSFRVRLTDLAFER